MKRFENQVAIITGAAGGIGAATAKRLHDEGAFVALIDLDEATLTASAEQSGLARFSVHALSVADEPAVETAVREIAGAQGRIDVLFNNAGIFRANLDITGQTKAQWAEVFDVNVHGPMLFMKHVVPVMLAQKSGAIVNTASVAGIRAGAGDNAYSASKAAVINMTQTAACDLGAAGIRVNAVCPGLVETGMTKPVFDQARAMGKEDRLGARCELRRYGEPSEIAAAVAFLASSDASFITGQALAVDGGNTASLNLPGMKF